MAEFMTRIQLKIDSLAAWQDVSKTNQGGNLVLNKGEIGLCEIPASSTEATNAPTILFKVGDGTHKFSELNWTSAFAADVHSWAKQSQHEFVTNFLSLKDSSNVTIQSKLDAVFATDQALTNAVAAIQEQITNLAVGALEGRVQSLENWKTSHENTVAGYGDIITHNASEFATSAQGGKADSAIQSINIAGNELTKTGNTLTADTLKTSLGLKSAAYQESTAFATAAQGSKADSAVQSVSLSTGSTNGTVKLTVDNVAGQDVQVKGLGSAAFTEAGAYDAFGSAAAAETAAKTYAKNYADDVKKSILGEDLTETYDTLKEIANWIEGDGVNATELSQAIAAEAKTRGDADSALDGRVSTLEKAGYITNAALNGYATQDWVTDQNYATQTWVTNKGYATTGQVATAKQEAIDAAASDAAGKYETIGTANSAIAALDLPNTYEPKGAQANAKDYTDGQISALNIGQYAKSTDLATVATSGLINDLTQTKNTVIVFNCGTSTLVI